MIAIFPFLPLFVLIDVLTKNLVKTAQNWDREDNLTKRPCERTTAHLDALVGAINKCGVSFQIWEKKNADGNRSGILDFTSLMGNDKKLLLKHLPAQLNGIVKLGTSALIQLWEVQCCTHVAHRMTFKHIS